jgi:hypothetical protein
LMRSNPMDKSRTNSVLLVLLERSERFRARTRSRALGVKCRWYRGVLGELRLDGRVLVGSVIIQD